MKAIMTNTLVLLSLVCIGFFPGAKTYAQNDTPQWSPPTRITNTVTPSVAPTLALDSLGGVGITWTEGPYRGGGWYDDVYFTMLDQNGVAVIPNTRLPYTGWQWSSSIAYDSNDNLHVVWHNRGVGCEEMFHRIVDNLGNVGSAQQITSTPSRCNTDIPLIAIDANNDLHMVYQDEVNDPINGDSNLRRDLFYKKYSLR